VSYHYEKKIKAVPGKGIVASVNPSTRNYVKASTSGASIPAPFNKYYDVATRQDFQDMGLDTDYYMVPSDAYENYRELELIGHAVAKPEYEEALGEYSCVDIVRDSSYNNSIMLVLPVGDRIYDVSINEIEDLIDNASDI